MLGADDWSHEDNYEMRTLYEIKSTDQVRWVMNREQKKKKKAEQRKERICFLSSLSSPLSFQPSPLFSPYPYDIPLQVQSSPLFSLSLSLCSPVFFRLSVFFLCELLFFGGISVAEPHPSQTTSLGWHPTLYSPVHCNSATVSTRFVVDGWMGSPPSPLHPSAVNGSYQTEVWVRWGVCHQWWFSYVGGLHHICVLDSLRLKYSNKYQRWLYFLFVCFLFVFYKINYCMKWAPPLLSTDLIGVVFLRDLWCPPSPPLPWGLLLSAFVACNHVKDS